MMGMGMLVFCVLMLGGRGWHGRSFIGCSTGRWIPRRSESPSDLLRRRYSQGEITREQFEEMGHTLGLSDADSTNEPADH
jgi:uncharacterized membrane protein